jgi:hypothetical protein
MTRLLTRSEIDLIGWIIKDSKEAINIIPKLPTLLVEEMNDGGMGSLRAVSNKSRIYSKDIGEIELTDIDGVYLLISVNVDMEDNFFELDVWKADSSPLKQFPSVPQ